MKNSIFFDLDGTLTDPKIGITRSIQYALEKLAFEVPASESLTWCIGPPLLQSMKILVGEQQSQAALGYYRERFADVGWLENSPYSEIGHTLATLQDSGLSLFVATSKPRIYAERIVEHFELGQYFDRVFGSELDGTRSNKAELLRYALSATGSSANPVMVGDREHDVYGALSNHMRAIGVTYGYGSLEELRNAGATHIVEQHADLLPLLL